MKKLILNLLFTHMFKEYMFMIPVHDANPSHISPIPHRSLEASITGSSCLNIIFYNPESHVAINISTEAVIADYYSKQP